MSPDTSQRPDTTQPAPALLLQRIQGRLAMIGFVAGAAAEASSQQPILEQFAGSWFSVVFVSLLIGLGSLMPKFTSGGWCSQACAVRGQVCESGVR